MRSDPFDLRRWFSLLTHAGLGTFEVPHGNVGIGMLAINGPANDVDGPHIQLTVHSDDYPVYQILANDHDNTGQTWDAYYDGGNWRSSDLGSNFALTKAGDHLIYYRGTGHAAGNIITWAAVFSMDTTPTVVIGTGGPFATSAGAALEVKSTVGAFLLPRMTTAQRNALAAPQNGMMILNTTTGVIEGREGGAWVNL